MSSSDPVELRDRRRLPFFMVHTDALAAIRGAVGGARRARALGAYGVLCAIANEQRDLGEREKLFLRHAELASRLGTNGDTARQYLRAFADAEVARVIRRVDELGVPLPSQINLLAREGSFLTPTAATLEAIRRLGGAWLAALGLYLTMLELCSEQRHDGGGARCETTRRRLGERLGVSTRSIDAYTEALRSAGVLAVEQRTCHAGNLPNLYELIEPARAAAIGARAPEIPGAESDRPGRSERPRPAQDPARWGEAPDLTGRSERPHPAQQPTDPGANPGVEGSETCATAPSLTATAYARTGDTPEPSREEDLSPPSSTKSSTGEGEDDDSQLTEEAVALCERLSEIAVARTTPARLARPDSWPNARQKWLSAARQILVGSGYPAARARRALDWLVGDGFLGSQILTMPALAARIDQVVIRAESTGHTPTPGSTTSGDQAPGWEEAWRQIRRAIARHGADNRAGALAQLEHPALSAFVLRVGWRALCHDAADYRQREWRATYEQTAAQTPSDQEAA